MIRKHLNVEVNTHPTEIPPDPQETNNLLELVESYKGLVFDDEKVGCLKVKPIHLDYDTEFTKKQPPFRNIPAHYQKEVSKLLDFPKKQNVINDVNPRRSYDCVTNVVITDKKNGQIRMNIDNTPRNPGMKKTRFNVQTPHEIPD